MLYIKIKFFSRENKLYRLFLSISKSYLPIEINKKIFMELYSAKKSVKIIIIERCKRQSKESKNANYH